MGLRLPYQSHPNAADHGLDHSKTQKNLILAEFLTNQVFQRAGEVLKRYLVTERLSESHPEPADQLHLEDCETATCGIWLEPEETCRVLMETTWKLMFGE